MREDNSMSALERIKEAREKADLEAAKARAIDLVLKVERLKKLSQGCGDALERSEAFDALIRQKTRPPRRYGALRGFLLALLILFCVSGWGLALWLITAHPVTSTRMFFPDWSGPVPQVSPLKGPFPQVIIKKPLPEITVRKEIPRVIKVLPQEKEKETP